jgi:hypothetical protein
VVEAAGNGNVNLDQAACGTTFNRNVRDSGAIIVGAGGPPVSQDRQRLSFSSYGSRVDVQGWGRGVATTGYGDSYVNTDEPANHDFWYTNSFSGTSSASPIVAGAVADLQGIALNRFHVPLTAFQLRQLLVDTGSPQLGNTAENIGPRPNLREAIHQMTEGPIDLFFLIDLSGSFSDDLPVFQAQAPGIISALKTANPNIRFGLGKLEDYPISPFGSASAGDKAYERLVDLTFDTDVVLNTIAGLFTRFGDDEPQSQLPALYQAATGAGQSLSGSGFPEASIPSGQQANFRDGATKIFLLLTDAPFHRPGDSGAIPYPGPSFNETVAAIRALDPPKVIGVSSGTAAISDLREVAMATGAFAPPRGVDCDGNGTIDIPGGELLVCGISPSGVGVGEAIVALAEAAATTLKVNIDIIPGIKHNFIFLRSKGVVPMAILTADNFDATKVDVKSVTFGPAGAKPIRHRVKDVDHDGDLDLLLSFNVRNTGIVCGATFASFTGKATDGQAIEGTDSIKTLWCK